MLLDDDLINRAVGGNTARLLLLPFEDLADSQIEIELMNRLGTRERATSGEETLSKAIYKRAKNVSGARGGKIRSSSKCIPQENTFDFRAGMPLSPKPFQSSHMCLVYGRGRLLLSPKFITAVDTMIIIVIGC